MNSYIQALNPEKTAGYPRIGTDKLFAMAPGSFTYQGHIDQAIRFIEKFQLLDTSLWKLFVNQYRSNVDDADSGWRCEYWGKMMRGASFTYLYTQDEALYSVMEASVRDLLTTQDTLGRFSTYSIEKEFNGWDIWGRKYILLGLQYFWDICRDEPLKAAIVAAMCRHADYILSKIGPKTEGKLPITLATNYWKGLNSSSILEPHVRLYNMTGLRRYLDFAAYIVGNGAIEDDNLFDMAYEGKLYPYQYPVTKAYEMMSCFEGLLEYYRVTKIEKWRIAVENFVRLVMASDITVIGCAGCTHELFDHSALTQTDMERNLNIHMQETCVTVTWMKMCWQLLCLNGGVEYADAIERSAYNALLGTLNTQNKRNSMIRAVEKHQWQDQVDIDSILLPFDSYSPLLPNIRGKYVGGLKVMANGTFYGCCAAIGAAGTGLIPAVSAMLREDGVAVNLYLPGTIRTRTPDHTALQLTIRTAYPLDGHVEISVVPAVVSKFVLALRIPGWSKQAAAAINGEILQATAGTYLEIERAWQPGDVVTLNLDMRTRAVFQDGYVSLSRGPLVLARDARIGQADEAVAITVDQEGYVDVSLTDDLPFDHVAGFRVPTRDGAAITMVDYSSAGKTWDETSRMAAWLPCVKE